MATTMAKPSQAITFLLRATRFLSFRPHLVPSRALISIPHLSMPTRGGGGHRNGIASVGRRLGGVRAAKVNESGSVPSPVIHSMENKIKEALNADTVIVKDESGDGQHVSIYVVSSAFEGQTAVSRQRMVYKAIWEELQNAVHAVDQMVTRTPSEAAK